MGFHVLSSMKEPRLRAVARGADGRPGSFATSPLELTRLNLASRITGSIVWVVDCGPIASWDGGGDLPQVNDVIHFRQAGYVTKIQMSEQRGFQNGVTTPGFLTDIRFQIQATTTTDSPLGRGPANLAAPLNAGAVFGAWGEKDWDVNFVIPDTQETWNITMLSSRGPELDSWPVMLLHFVPEPEPNCLAGRP